MQVLFIPVRSEKNISYSFRGELVTAQHNGETDTFDFSDLPDGRLEPDEVATSLPINPIVLAEKKDGVLSVELLNFIRVDATDEEKFPEWFEVKEDGGNKMDVPGGNQ